MFANASHPALDRKHNLLFFRFGYSPDRQPVDKDVGGSGVEHAASDAILPEHHEGKAKREQNARLQLIPRSREFDVLDDGPLAGARLSLQLPGNALGKAEDHTAGAMPRDHVNLLER